MNIYKSGARYQIIKALKRDGMMPVAELITATKLTAYQVKNNTSAAKQAGLIVSLRDDVTGLPAWKLTSAGHDWWNTNRKPEKHKADKPGVSVHETTPAAAVAVNPPLPAAARPKSAPSTPAEPPSSAVDGGDGYEALEAKVLNYEWALSKIRSALCRPEKLDASNPQIDTVALALDVAGILESTLQQLDHLRDVIAKKHTPVAYIVRAHKRKPRLLTQEKAARNAALSAVRNGCRYATVFSLIPNGSAYRSSSFIPIDVEVL